MTKSGRALVAALLVGAFAACEQKPEPPPSEACATLRVECPNESRATEERLRTSCAANAACAEHWTCVARNAVCDGRGRFDEAATIARCSDAGACGASDAGDDVALETGEDAEPEVAVDTAPEAAMDVSSDTRSDARVDAKVTIDAERD